MALYVIGEQNYDLPSHSALIDTNLLVAYFDERDRAHENARIFFAMIEEELRLSVVPMSVLVETWGMLVGRNRNHPGGIKLLEWLSQPGIVTIVPDIPTEFPTVSELVSHHKLDVVDAMILRLSHDIQTKCEMRDPLPIASMDRRDFVRVALQAGIAIRLYNIDSLDIEAYGVSAQRRSESNNSRTRRPKRR